MGWRGRKRSGGRTGRERERERREQETETGEVVGQGGRGERERRGSKAESTGSVGYSCHSERNSHLTRHLHTSNHRCLRHAKTKQTQSASLSFWANNTWD